MRKRSSQILRERRTKQGEKEKIFYNVEESKKKKKEKKEG